MVTENIYEIGSRFRAVLVELGYTETTITKMLGYAKNFIRLHEKRGESQLNNCIINDFLSHEERRYQKGEIRRTTFLMHKTIDEYLTQIYETDTITRKRRSHLPVLPDCLESVLSDILSNEEWSLRFRKGLRNRIGTFFRWLCSHGHSDLNCVDETIDRNTALGKRDYAIILLAAVTGLRACDIVRLTLDSVDWRNGEIRIIQGKTGSALALPLTVGLGESIREYILNARPHRKSDKIFLNSRAPFGEMQASTLTTSFQRYCDKAEITSRRGFHSLRRSVATNMVTSGVSVITVTQTLGHATIDSTKQYISLDNKNLKECVLDFSGIQIGGDVL